GYGTGIGLFGRPRLNNTASRPVGRYDGRARQWDQYRDHRRCEFGKRGGTIQGDQRSNGQLRAHTFPADIWLRFHWTQSGIWRGKYVLAQKTCFATAAFEL